MVRANLPATEPFLDKKLARYPEHTIVAHLGSGNNGHVFRACDAAIGSDIALKFVPVENLKEDLEEDEYRLEARLPNTIRHPSVVKYTRAFRWRVPHEWDTPQLRGREFVVFECEFVNGTSLREFIKESRKDLSVPFVKQFLTCMFELLFELTERPDAIQHGDLHEGNILVEPPTYDVYGRFRFRVTDFGASEFALSSAHRSDFLSVANILRSLLASLPGRPSSALERYEFEVLRDDFLSRHLIETDRLADRFAQNPRELLAKLNAMDVQFIGARDERTGDYALTTPFDYPNCEQIGSSNLLLKNLYSERVLGLGQIEGRANTVVTGPRGCGKTTVFRALSLDYRVSVGADSPPEIGYIGIYYRCDDLYFSFPRYQLPDGDNGLNVPMHFLVVTLIAGLLKSLRSWHKRHFPNSLVAVEARVCEGIRDTLGMEPAKDPSGASFEGLVSALENRQRKRAQRKQQHLHKEQAFGYCGPEALVRIVALLREHASFLADRPIYFFIDDYSEPKITLDLQRNLNRLLMIRGADMFFKISTESPVSFARTDVDGKAYVENREYELLNLGLRFLKSLPQGLEFLRDLFRKRFQMVQDFPIVSLEELLGSESPNENDRARAIREKRRSGIYTSEQTVAAMCSGDIHYVLRLVQRMVEDFGGIEKLTATGSVPRIPQDKQHASIRAAAGEFIQQVRDLPRSGEKLAAIVDSFGAVAHSHLMFRNSKNEDGNPPHQASRIEPYEAPSLSQESKAVLVELLRYSIFLEDPRGKSRRGNVVPRYYLRRYLIPHFWLSFSRRDSLELESGDLEQLLSQPTAFERSKRLKAEYVEDLTIDMFREGDSES